jgi:hypothetical protein
MAKMANLMTTDSVLVNDCIVCDTAERMRAEGRTAWSVSTAGQPLCGECNYERMMEIRD